MRTPLRPSALFFAIALSLAGGSGCGLPALQNPADPTTELGLRNSILRCLLDNTCTAGSSSGDVLGSGAALPNPIYLFNVNGGIPGGGSALAAGRAAGNTGCATERALRTFPVNTCSSVLGFYSFSAGDSIAAMPGNYGIDPARPIHGTLLTVGGAALVIANNWGEMLDGAIDTDPTTASGMASAYWTFSDASGNYDAINNCGGVNGATGNPFASNGTWLAGVPNGCGTGTDLVCICY